MPIADVMSPRVVSVQPDETVHVAISRMLEENVGSVAVCEQERLVGIFTERDVLRLAGGGADFQALRVGDVMTRTLVTVSPDVEVVDAARLMSERKIRHLPVLQGEHLLGVVGIREVMRSLVEHLWRKHDPDVRETARGLLEREPSATS
ncbi:MAG TPA: CBS domain-containing protein [Gaiellaceae bacterium]